MEALSLDVQLLLHVVQIDGEHPGYALLLRRRKVHSAPPGIYAGYTLCSLAPPLPMKTHCVFMGASYGFPVLKIGSRMVVPKEQFICWVEEHTGGGT